MKLLARFAAVLLLAFAPVVASAQFMLLGAGPGVKGGGLIAGDPLSLAITSAIWTSSTDLTPVSQFVNGFTGDLTLNATTPAGVTSAYAFGTDAAPKLSVPVTRPGYSVSGGANT